MADLFSSTDLVVAAAALIGAFVSGLSGFAFGLIAVGVWLQVLPPTITGPLVLICGGLTSSMSLIEIWPAVRLNRVLPMILGGFLGIPAGIWLLTRLEPALLRRGVGAFLVLYALFMLLAPRFVVRRAGHAADGAVGFIGGVMSGAVGLSGAVPTAWTMVRGWHKDEARAVYQPFNLPILLVTLAGEGATGVLEWRHFYYALLCVPMLLIGVRLGIMAYRRLDAAWFRRIVLYLLLASGAMLVI